MNPVDIEGSRLEHAYREDVKPKVQLSLQPRCRFDDKEVKVKVRRSSKYPFVEWGVLTDPPCAVVGGGAGLPSCIETLRNWRGDIFAINDTAGYLSDQGIPCYIYSIDAIDEPFRIGPLVKGAVFGSRVHRKQFTNMKGKPIRIFHMAEDNNGVGVEGGPTAVCRTPHLFLRMGYMGIYYFGIESCFYNVTHTGGNRSDAFWNMIIVEVGGRQYLTNGGFLLQAQWMVDMFKKYPKFLFNCAGGFMKAMLEDTQGYTVIAVSDDLRKQYEVNGTNLFNKEHTVEEDKLWRPPLVFERQSMEAR